MAKNPKYIEIANYFIEKIRNQEFKVNDPLESEEKLCSQFNVSHMTMAKAMNELSINGYIKRIPGKGTFISDTVHKANISFSNDGIKASAVTLAGGMGDGGCNFDYFYEIPVKEIDLTFDKPYMYIIRDKESGEVWFAGTVYEPNLYTQNQ